MKSKKWWWTNMGEDISRFGKEMRDLTDQNEESRQDNSHKVHRIK